MQTKKCNSAIQPNINHSKIKHQFIKGNKGWGFREKALFWPKKNLNILLGSCTFGPRPWSSAELDEDNSYCPYAVGQSGLGLASSRSLHAPGSSWSVRNSRILPFCPQCPTATEHRRVRRGNLSQSDMEAPLHGTSLQPLLQLRRAPHIHSWGQGSRGVSLRVKAPDLTCHKSQLEKWAETERRTRDGRGEGGTELRMNLCPMDREVVPGVRGLARRERLRRVGTGEDRGKGPTNVSSGNLVLTEKGDLDEDKYSPQVKTSKSLDKDTRSCEEEHRGSGFCEEERSTHTKM